MLALLFKKHASALSLAIALSAVPQVRAQTGIPTPVIPNHTADITQFGAKSDNTTLNTDAIQKTIAAITAQGGGHVVIPAGHFASGPITLTSNIDLHLDTGATLAMSPRVEDYRVTDRNSASFISASDSHNIRLSGSGVIDGQGAPWWKIFRAQKAAGASAPPPPADDLPRPMPAHRDRRHHHPQPSQHPHLHPQ